MPTHLPKNHPVRFLLEAAASGRELTRGDLAHLAAADDGLPPGQSLTRFEGDVLRLSKEVARLGAQGNHHQALEKASEAYGTLGDSMSSAQRSIDGVAAKDDPTTDAAAFGAAIFDR